MFSTYLTEVRTTHHLIRYEISDDHQRVTARICGIYSGIEKKVTCQISAVYKYSAEEQVSHNGILQNCLRRCFTPERYPSPLNPFTLKTRTAEETILRQFQKAIKSIDILNQEACPKLKLMLCSETAPVAAQYIQEARELKHQGLLIEALHAYKNALNYTHGLEIYEEIHDVYSQLNKPLSAVQMHLDIAYKTLTSNQLHIAGLVKIFSFLNPALNAYINTNELTEKQSKQAVFIGALNAVLYIHDLHGTPKDQLEEFFLGLVEKLVGLEKRLAALSVAEMAVKLHPSIEIISKLVDLQEEDQHKIHHLLRAAQIKSADYEIASLYLMCALNILKNDNNKFLSMADFYERASRPDRAADCIKLYSQQYCNDISNVTQLMAAAAKLLLLKDDNQIFANSLASTYTCFSHLDRERLLHWIRSVATNDSLECKLSNSQLLSKVFHTVIVQEFSPSEFNIYKEDIVFEVIEGVKIRKITIPPRKVSLFSLRPDYPGLFKRLRSSHTQVLSLSGISLKNKDFETLFDGLPNSLEELYINDTGFKKVHVKIAMEAVNKVGLQVLSLTDNTALGDYGAMAIGEFLGSVTLSRLLLDRCSIYDKGATALTQKINDYTKIHISLKGNQLTYSTANSLKNLSNIYRHVTVDVD